MKLLVISPVLPPIRAGEADYAYHLCRELVARGVDVHLLTSAEKSGRWGCPDGVTLHAVARDWGWNDVPRLAAVVTEVAPDAIVMPYIGWIFRSHPMATYLPWLAKRWAPRARFVTIFYNRIGASLHENTFTARLGRKLLSRWVGGLDSCYEFGTLLTTSDRIAVLAEKHGAWLASVTPGSSRRMDLVPPPPCLHLCGLGEGAARVSGRRLLDLESSDFVVTFFGYVYPGKGLETLFDAFARFAAGVPEARLAVVGGALDERAPGGQSYRDELFARAKALGIEDRLRWSGQFSWDDDRASRMLFASDVAAMPFDVGIALNNSSVAAVVAHGLPLVSTRPVNLEPAFRDRENVLLAPPKDAEALASLLGHTHANPDLRLKLRRGSLGLARAWFSWDRAIDTLLGGCFPRLATPPAQEAAGI